MGPSTWDHQIRNVENFPQIIPNIVASIDSGMMIDQDIVNFIQSRLLPLGMHVPDSWINMPETIFFAKNANILLNQIFTNPDSNGELAEESIRSEFRRSIFHPPPKIDNYGEYTEQMAYNLAIWNATRPKPSIEWNDKMFVPDEMEDIIKNKKHVSFLPNLGLELSRSFESVPFLTEYLQNRVTMENQEEFCQILKLLHGKLAKYNYYSIIRFLRDTPFISILPCAQEFVGRLDPLAAQMLLGSSQDCWFDSRANNSNPCGNCVFPWVIWKALPQWRCLALCSRTYQNDTIQCGRFAERGDDYCLYHQANMGRKLKRYCGSNCPSKDALPSQYASNPFEVPAIRYLGTNRVVNPMTEIFETNDKKPPIGFYLPVVRYTSLYYSTKESENKTTQPFCGKFFYYEPTSPHCLYLGKCSFFATKVQAYMELEAANPQLRSRESLWLYSVIPDWHKYPSRFFSGFYSTYPLKTDPKNRFFPFNVRNWTLQFPEEERQQMVDSWLLFYFSTLFASIADAMNCKFDDGIPVFYPTTKPLHSTTFTDDDPSAFVSHPMGTFDFLDQPICNMARAQGYDTVIFQHEMGEHDAVTEIMSTRQDYKHAGFKFENVENKIPFRAGAVFPKLWFPQSNGIVQVHPDETTTLQSLPLEKWSEVFSKFTWPTIEHEHGKGFTTKYIHTVTAEEYQPEKSVAQSFILPQQSS
jgi:hypothetical protein